MVCQKNVNTPPSTDVDDVPDQCPGLSSDTRDALENLSDTGQLRTQLNYNWNEGRGIGGHPEDLGSKGRSYSMSPVAYI